MNYQDLGDTSADGRCVLLRRTVLWYVQDTVTNGRFFGEDEDAAIAYAAANGRYAEGRPTRMWEPIDGLLAGYGYTEEK